jgi:hypothetical protein
MLQHKYMRSTLFFSFVVSLFCEFSSYTMQESVQESIEQQQHELQEQQADRCSMCWETMSQEQDALVQLSCHPSHVFHKPCLESWLNERIQQDQALACLYCNQELLAEDRAKLNLNEVQTAPAQQQDIAQEIPGLQQALQDIDNVIANLPPKEQLLETMKAETRKTLSSIIPREDIEHFIAQLPDVQDMLQEQDPLAILNFISQIPATYIQTFNIQNIPYEHAHVHFTLLGRMITLSLEHCLPLIKCSLKHIQFALGIIGIAQEDPAIPKILQFHAMLKPLTGQDIKRLIEPLFTVPLDQHNWQETKMLLINSINQLNNIADGNNIVVNFGNTIGNTIVQFAQLNPKLIIAAKHIPQQYKYLMLKKNIMHKLNNPWIKSTALMLCSAAFIKLCEHMYNNWQ